MGEKEKNDDSHVLQLDNTQVRRPILQLGFLKATPTLQIQSYIKAFGYPELPIISALEKTPEEKAIVRDSYVAKQAKERLKKKGLLIRENIGFVPLVGDVLDAGVTGYEVVTKQAAPAMLGLSVIGMVPFGDFFRLGKNVKTLQNISDLDWDIMYTKALELNDQTLLQKLRDLHFQAKAPNTKITTADNIPVHAYHGTGKHFTEFDTTGKYSLLDEGYWGKGAYFAPNKEVADIYANGEKTPVIYDTYLNIENPQHIIMENDDYYGKQIRNHDGVIATLPEDIIDPDFDMTEYVVTKPNQIKLADAITKDDNGKIIPLSKRDDFTNPDIRYFKDKYGKEITPTPYPGPDSDLINAVLHSLRNVLRDYFSREKINQIKTTMNWGNLEISELLSEILRTIGFGPNVLIKGPMDGFTDIALHQGLLIGAGSEAKGFSTVVLNRERIPDVQMALESGIHEIGVHGKTASLKPENFGKGGRDDMVKDWFPRLAELSLKNKELANLLLQPNRVGRFLGLFLNVGDLEKYFVNKGLSWNKWQKFYDAWKRYKYVTASDETTARAYTGQLFNKVYDPNKKTLNIKLLELYNTPESVEAFKKAVLGVAPVATAASLVPSDKKGSKILIKENKMKNFGIKQIGFHQTGTVKGGLQPQNYSGSWGDRGQGNELLSAFENGLSWIGDKVMNAGDYIDLGLAYLTGLIPGGMTADESLQDTRLAQSARNAGEPGYMDIYGEYQMFPNAGVAPLPTPLKNPSPELSKMYDGLKKLRWNVQIRESQLRKAGQLDKIESTLTAKKYKEAEQAYLNAVEEFKANQPHMKRMTNDVILTRKQDASFKRNKAAATNDGRANNQGRPVLKERQWDWVEEMMRKDPKAAGVLNRYEIKVAKGMDKKHLREARKKMLEEYARSRPGFFDYLLKKNE